MKKALIVIVVLIVSGLVFLTTKNDNDSVTMTPTPTPSPAFTEYTASFEIYTLGTKRIFTDTKYHNRSADVFITASAPSVIYVKGSGITWADFFATLPMKLDENCLTTGTGQTFCTGEKGTLLFEINGIENPDALSREIKSGDTLVVTFK